MYDRLVVYLATRLTEVILVSAFFCSARAYLFAQASESNPQQYYEEGEKALAENRYADAERAYERACQLSPGVAEVYAKLGLIYFQQGKFRQAAPALRQALKLKPSLPKADVLLAMSLAELGQFKEAAPVLEKAFRNSADPPLRRMTGLELERTYTGLGLDSKAVEVALELSRLYPDDPEVLYHAARLFGNYAFVTMRKLADIAPQSVWRHQAAGEVYESEGKYDLAIAEYREVLRIDPRRPGIHFRLGRALLAAGQDASHADAAKQFELELAVDPTNANAAYELAEISRRSGQVERARDLFEQAIKFDPDFEQARVGLGRALLALRKPQDALVHLRKAAALDPEDAVAYFQLARAYAELAEKSAQQKALDEYRRIQQETMRREQATMKRAIMHRDVTKQELGTDLKP